MLNDVVIKHMYPFRQINTLFDPLIGATVFSKMVLSLGHHKLKVRSEVILKAVIKTRFALYEYTFMSSELINTSYVFTRHVKSIFMEYLDKFVVVHLNDVLIYSKSEDEHVEHLRLAWKKLREHHLWRPTF